MNQYKTFEKLKEELGDKFEEYMYKANIELLNKIDKAIDYIEKHRAGFVQPIKYLELLDILKGSEDELKKHSKKGINFFKKYFNKK